MPVPTTAGDEFHTIWIDDFIELRGRGLVAQQAGGAWNMPGIDGVEMLILHVKDQPTLRFVCAAAAPSWPHAGTGSSQVRWTAGTIGKSSETLYTAKQGAHVGAHLHLPSPLSPDMTGYWFVLNLVKTNQGWQFDFSLSGAVDHPWFDSYIYCSGNGPGHWDQAPAAAKIGVAGVSITGRLELAEVLNKWTQTARLEAFGQQDPDAHRLFESKQPLLLRTGVDDPEPSIAFWLVLEPFDVPNGKAYDVLSRVVVAGDRKTVRKVTLSALTGGETATGHQPFNLVHQGRAEMVCATAQSPASSRRDVFFIEWRNLSGDHGEQGQLSFRGMWAVIASHYALGLAATRSRNRLSVFPGDICFPGSGADGWGGAWNFRFRVERTFGAGDRVDWLLRLVEVLPASATAPVPTTIVLSGATDRDRAAISRTVDLGARDWRSLVAVGERGAISGGALVGLETRPREGSPQSATGAAAAPAADDQDESELIVGGVALRLGALEFVSLTVASASPLLSYAQAPVEADARLTFAGRMPAPASQDPESGFETLSAWQNRERPISIDLAPAQDPVRINFLDSARHDQSRVLRIDVRAVGHGTLPRLDTVIIDPAPLLVARATVVDPQPFADDDLLAEYTDDAETPAEWAFANATGAVNLTLPPQAIGEEMVKGTLQYPAPAGNAVAVPRNNELFDFRLSPAAQVAVDLSDIDVARPIAPWATRRLFSNRLGVVGVKMIRARFELLYGLTTQAGGEGLRLAETDAFVGRIPFSDDMLMLLRQRRVDTMRGGVPATGPASGIERARDHAAQVADWIGGLFRRPAQLTVFRDFADRTRLTLDAGIAFEQRKSRETANPFQLDELAAEALAGVKTQPAREPLRGGVDFAFESVNVANEFWGDARRGTGKISGLRFGTLGGSGAQEAVFNQGKTLVITDTTDGRLNSLTLIRLGRIAMLWNQARHVIVYERSTRTAPRYQRRDGKIEDQPTAFEGLAALRKVREYVEITQARRQYPDTVSDRPLCGPLLAASFETMVIPVKSSWGRDVEDGWVVALRGPIEPAEERFYPFPKIFLQFARAAAKGEGYVNQQVDDPADLLFFTSTSDKEGGDTDAWPAWPDIDYPVLGRPRPPATAAAPRLGNALQPDATRHDLGQRHFTIDLRPAGEAINLMHGRPVAGVEAKLHNICLARGMPDPAQIVPAAHVDVAMLAGGRQSEIGEGLTELSERLRDLAAKAPDAPLDEATRRRAKELAQQLVAAAKSKELVDAGLLPAVAPGPAAWAARQAALQSESGKHDAYYADGKAGLWPLQLAGAVAGIVHFTAPNVEDARARLLDTLEQVCRQVEDRLDGLPDIAAQALAGVERLVDEAEDRVRGLSRAECLRLVALIDQAEASWRGGGALTPAVRDALAAAVQATPLAVARLIGQAPQWLQAALHQWFGAAPGAEVAALAPFVDDLGEWLAGVEDWAEDWITQLDAGSEPDWAVLRLLAESLDPAVPLFGDARAWVAQREQEALAAVEDQRAAIRQGLQQTCESIAGTIRQYDLAQLKGSLPELSRLVDAAGPALDKLRAGISQNIANLSKDPGWQTIIGATQSLENYRQGIEDKLGDIVNRLGTAGNDAVAAVFADMQQTIAPIQSSLETLGAQIESAVAGEVTNWRSAAQLLRTSALETTRALATAPVTDTIDSTRLLLGYYYQPAAAALDVTRSTAVFNHLAGDALNSLSAAMPFDRLRDRLLPQLANFDVNKLLPDFGGLKLENLLKDLVVPDDPLREYDWIKMAHGFDPDRLTAWADVNIDKQFDSDPALFTLPPLVLSVARPHFVASSRLEIGKDGARTQTTRAVLTADWVLSLNGKSVMTIKQAALKYDSRGGFDFDMDVNALALDETLKFLTDAMQALRPNDSGVTIMPILPGGIGATLDLPLPDIGTGAFTLTGVTLSTHFDLLFAPKFEVRTGLWLSKPERPFGLAILFLGGGGWFGVDVAYQPPATFVTRVSIGIAAGAFAALNFGVASGSAGLLFTASLDFYNASGPRGGSSTAITVGLLMWGELSICCIASAYIRLVMRVTQQDGAMTGYGMLSVSIKICWCFTLNVNCPIAMPFAGGSRHASLSAAAVDPLPGAVDSNVIAAALTAHFANLDI